MSIRTIPTIPIQSGAAAGSKAPKGTRSGGADVVVAQFRVANCTHSGPAPGPPVLSSTEYPLAKHQAPSTLYSVHGTPGPHESGPRGASVADGIKYCANYNESIVQVQRAI